MAEKNIKTYVVIKHKYNKRDADWLEHSHTFYQLMYIASGEGEVNVAGEALSVKTGDVVFIAPNVEHSINFRNSNMTTYEIKFDIFDEELDQIAGTIDTLHYEEDNKIKNLILKIVEECKECKPYYKKSVENFISQIIIYLTRQKTFFEEDEEKMLVSYERHSSLAAQIKTFIDFNYSKRVTLAELADIFSVSQSHLCREFTKNFNLSPIKYLNNMRIEKAKELLSVSDLSISEIAYKVGFNDIHYFSRYFNKQEEISPVKFRKNIRSDIVFDMSKEM